MHVIVIADFAAASGGAQAVAILSALALRARGVAVTYLYAISGVPDPRLAAAGIELVGLGLDDVWDRPALRAAVTGIWNREASSRLRRALAGAVSPATVLHMHQWTRSLSPSAFPALLATGRPLAITLHDYFIACPNGVYYRFERDRPCELTPLSAACLAAPCDPRSSAHKAIRVLRSLATRRAIAAAPLDVVHVSDRARDTLAPFLPSTWRQHRIDNPVEAERRHPAPISAGAKLAYVGRLTREKGADLAAEAARAADMPMLFVGEGPAEAEIRRLNPAAEILGWRPRAELDRLLQGEIRAVVAPSRWYETGPLTVYEAMACGVPAVASRRSGAAERVLHGETGFVAEPDAASMADAFRRLAPIETVRQLGGAAFASYWSDPPSAARHAERLLGLYGAMLGRQNGR